MRLPNPFDPVEETEKPRSQTDQSEETQIAQMVNEGGPAPSVVVETDGNHSSARWANPRKKP